MAGQFQPRFVDLVRNFTTTTGTGDFALGPAVNGYASFTDACAAGDSFYYSVASSDFPGERETGRGTLSADGTIQRDPISGSKTDFSPGTKSIALVASAEWFEQAHSLVASAGATGRSVVAAATAAEARGALEIGSGFSVKWFGAKGDANDDGSTGSDDTAAIQAALDHVDSIGGGTVLVPEGRYKISAYLRVHPHTTVAGMGRKASRIIATHAGGGGTTPGESVRNGSIFYSECPINTTGDANISIEKLWLHNANQSNQGAGVYQQSGDTIAVRHCEISGAKWGIILDQSEDVLIEFCQPSSYIPGGAGIWIVNGPDLNPAASTQFSNAISIRDCHLNVVSGSYGIVDDGGYSHVISGGDFNGGINGIRASGVLGLVIDGCYAESQSQEIVALDSYTLAGQPVGGSFVTVQGGHYSPPAGYGAFKGYHGPGCISIVGGSYSASSAPLKNTALFSFVSVTNPGLAGYPATPFCDGTAAYTHLDMGHLHVGQDGKVGIANVWNASGGIMLSPAATSGFLEAFDKLGARVGYGFFLNGSALQFGAEGSASSFQFLSPLSVAGSIVSSAGGLGYSTGAGGVVSQGTSKATGVTLNKACGKITMNAAALAAGATASFVLTDSLIGPGDLVVLNHVAGGTFGAYTLNARGAAAGSVTIDVTNRSAASLSEAIVIGFAVIKGALS